MNEYGYQICQGDRYLGYLGELMVCTFHNNPFALGDKLIKIAFNPQVYFFFPRSKNPPISPSLLKHRLCYWASLLTRIEMLYNVLPHRMGPVPLCMGTENLVQRDEKGEGLKFINSFFFMEKF